jgi:hypothetical protein
MESLPDMVSSYNDLFLLEEVEVEEEEEIIKKEVEVEEEEEIIGVEVEEIRKK